MSTREWMSVECQLMSVGAACAFMCINCKVLCTAVLPAFKAAPKAGVPASAHFKALVAEDFALLTLLSTRYQPGPAMAAVLAGAYEGGKLEGVVPAGGGATALSKCTMHPEGVCALMAALMCRNDFSRCSRTVHKGKLKWNVTFSPPFLHTFDAQVMLDRMKIQCNDKESLGCDRISRACEVHVPA
eukprot:1159117-Pelagomonas_calceolata.AAC.9